MSNNQLITNMKIRENLASRGRYASLIHTLKFMKDSLTGDHNRAKS